MDIHTSAETSTNRKYVICEKSTIIGHDYNIGDKVMVRINKDYKYETTFQGPYEIVQNWKNRTVTIQAGAVTARLNIRLIKPYNSTEVE